MRKASEDPASAPPVQAAQQGLGSDGAPGPREARPGAPRHKPKAFGGPDLCRRGPRQQEGASRQGARWGPP